MIKNLKKKKFQKKYDLLLGDSASQVFQACTYRFRKKRIRITLKKTD